MEKNANKMTTSFSLFETDYTDAKLLEIPSFFEEALYAKTFALPPISLYCTEDYECSGGQCSACLDCQTDCKKGSCQSNCQTGISCQSSCQTSSSCQSQSSHTHVWKYTDWQSNGSTGCKRLKYCDGAGTCPTGASEEYQSHSFSGDTCTACGYTRPSSHTHVWKYTDWQPNGSTGCKRLKYCDGSGTCPTGASEEYQSHSYSGCTCSSCGYTKSHTWVTNHHESGASGCSSPSGTSHPHNMHNKCSSCGTCTSSGSTASWSELVTCVPDGCWDNVRCSRCNVFIRTKEHHHSGGASATCTTPAKCKCGKTDIGNALGHNYVNGVCTRCGGIDETYCEHPSISWGNWYESGNGDARDGRCYSNACGGKVVSTESTSSHDMRSTGKLEPSNADFHKILSSCSRCLKTGYTLERHNWVNGSCVCGATNAGGGGGGGVILPPEILSFSATSSPNGMEINCSVSGKNTTSYAFSLYTKSGTYVDSSGSTKSTSYTFQSIPNTAYTVSVVGYNDLSQSASASRDVTTPNIRPPKFAWRVEPTKSQFFRLSVTATDWLILQNTINAWREYYGQPKYQLVLLPSREDTFTVANMGDTFSYVYYNQIINSIKTIPQFVGTLPSKKTTDPEKWLASDFKQFATAVNSFA